MLVQLFIYLGLFIITLFVFQVIFFEISRNAAIKTNNYGFFDSLTRPFSYTRTGSMIFICIISFYLGRPNVSGLERYIYLLAFIASGVIADAFTQFLIQKYGQFRCRKQILMTKQLENEFNELSEAQFNEDNNYQTSFPSYDEKEIAKRYLNPTDHLAFMSVDNGEFAKNFNDYPEATFDVEPYSDEIDVQRNLEGLPIRATKLTENNQMPFKDKRIDMIVNQYSNYDKYEIDRVLKNGGYFITNQYGSHNLKEFLQMYMPVGLKGVWDKDNCKRTLQELGYDIFEENEDYGYIKFYNLKQLHTYFKYAVPEVYQMVERYKPFYLKALKEIQDQGFFKLTTYRFIVVARKK